MAEQSPLPPMSQHSPWVDRHVLLGVTGGIACFKTAALASRLVQSGAKVRVVMTRAATRFVTALTFESLSGHSVVTDFLDHGQAEGDSAHIGVARWCDLMIVAPATADTLARLAAGLSDNPVTLAAAALPTSTPVLLAPAMNEQMWENPVTQRNLATVKEMLGYHTVGPAAGWQACRTQGAGRMSEPEAIMEAAETVLGSG